jgi:F-type H+-transporting ATPase subunit a
MRVAVLMVIFPGLHPAPISPEKDFVIGPLAITNSKLASLLALALIIVFAWAATRNLRERPGRFQSAVELLVHGLYEFAKDTGGRYGEELFPVFASLFIFLMTANLMALVPGFGQIRVSDGKDSWPFLRAVNTDFNSPLALALMVFLMAHVYGVRSHGIAYFNEFINVRAMRDLVFHGKVGAIIDILVGIFELIGNLARVVSLSVRLFANIFAGELLIAVLLYLFPLAAVPIEILELAIVAWIQALIFGLLMLVYISLVGDTEGHTEQSGAEHAHSPAAEAA